MAGGACATPATASGDLARLPDPTLAQPKPAHRETNRHGCTFLYREQQFRREITVWSKLKHPNILQLLGIIRDPRMHPDIPAMVCPWIECGALTTYLERNNDLMIAKRFVLVSIHLYLWLTIS